MDKIGPDKPRPSRYVRVAMAQNRAADHDLKVTLNRMEGERHKTFEGHNQERLKLLHEMWAGSSTDAKTPDDSRSSTSLASNNVTDVHHGRLLARDEIGHSRVHLEGNSPRIRPGNSLGYVKINNLVQTPLGSPKDMRRRYTGGMSLPKTQPMMNQGHEGYSRRRSMSWNDADLYSSRQLASQSKDNMDVQTKMHNPSSLANEMPKARPQSAVFPRIDSIKEGRRSSSTDIVGVFKSAKRNGVLEPLNHPRLESIASGSQSPNMKLNRRMYAKRFSEPELTLHSLSFAPSAILKLGTDSPTNSCHNNSSDDNDSSSGSDENNYPIQPYSIGNMRVSDSKGAFEQKTGKGGLRAWSGFSSPKLKNRILSKRVK